MDLFGVLSMLGGLALFLFGMNTMGDGLAKLSGGKLEKVLEKLTSNRLMAVLLGAGVTAVIQSSSATTVMVVGFVNSGIMKLRQAIGIIMGANIGTTITSWILSLTQIEGDSIIMKLCKPTSFSPVLALIGVIFLLFTKKDKLKNVGNLLVGFAILMTGMDAMSSAVKPLADVPEFTNILLMFSNPILGMLAGAVLTAVIQSSSASVGILQALCATGAVSFGTALPIIMGQNIGTCVTALISSIGAKKNARRAAMVHLYFNIIGTAIFMLVFYGAHMILDFKFLGDVANSSGIATLHTCFNVAATIILFPFAGVLEHLAVMTVRDKDTKKKSSGKSDALDRLDERFLNNPGYATMLCKEAAVDMANITREALFYSMDTLFHYSEERDQKIREDEDLVDRYEDELGNYLLRLSMQDLSDKDSKTLSMLLHCIGDLERISDHSVNILEAAEEMHKKELQFSEAARAELDVYKRALHDIIDTCVDGFISEKGNLSEVVEPLEEVIDTLNAKIKSRHIKRLREGKCTIELGFVLSDITSNYERIADHCSNIAVYVNQSKAMNIEPHEYLDMMKHGDESFKVHYDDIKKNYQLPPV